MANETGMSNNSVSRDGLLKMKEVADSLQEINDPTLVESAQQALQKQVARVAAVDVTELQWENTQAFEIAGNFRFVYAPLSQNQSDPSGLTVFYDLQGNHVHTVETLLSYPSETAHRLQVWDNGKLVGDETFDGGEPHAEWSWQALNDCLASNGISWATITVISNICAAVCVGTAGTGCVVCIVGVSGASGAVIGWCVGEAVLN